MVDDIKIEVKKSISLLPYIYQICSIHSMHEALHTSRSIAQILLIAIFSFSSFHGLRAETDPGLYLKPQPPDKTKYIIGGWDPNDNVQSFLLQYRPVLQDYLTSEVGHLFDPPITFELVPTDWPELGSNDSITAQTRMEQGSLDFVCKLRTIYSFSVYQ